MTRVLAALVLGASILGLAACSGGSSVMTPAVQSVTTGHTSPDSGGLPPNH